MCLTITVEEVTGVYYVTIILRDLADHLQTPGVQTTPGPLESCVLLENLLIWICKIRKAPAFKI